MIQNKWSLILVVLLMALLVLIEVLAPRPLDWSTTLSHNDKIPFGTYLLHQEMISRFPEFGPVSYQTIYEILQQEASPRQILSISNMLTLDSLDTNSLLEFVYQGGNALLSASGFYGSLADTLNVETGGGIVNLGVANLANMVQDDTTWLHFVNPKLDPHQAYHYLEPVVYSYFSSIDTLKSEVVAVNERGDPVMIKVIHGQGFLLLNCTPLAFGNYYLLQRPNQEFVGKTLSYLNPTAVLRTEYYQAGRQESQTVMRYVLSEPPLRWAYYFTLAGLLLFVVFEAKRRQRVIPVIEPLKNTTLDFVQTVGRLYYERGDHKNIAAKMITYFLDDIRNTFYINTGHLDPGFLEQLSHKSGQDPSLVADLFRTIGEISAQETITKEELQRLQRMIDGFRVQSNLMPRL